LSAKLMGSIFYLEIPALEKLVLLAMADHAQDDGTGCYPSVQRLATKTSLSRRGVQKISRRLEDAGFLVPSARIKGGRSLTTEYRITLEKGEPGSLFSSTKGRTAQQERANPVRPNHQEPSLNHQETMIIRTTSFSTPCLKT
jgi:biotin operon repressor